MEMRHRKSTKMEEKVIAQRRNKRNGNDKEGRDNKGKRKTIKK
jgi:hypothetical protein